jgi:hypothetical protein
MSKSSSPGLTRRGGKRPRSWVMMVSAQAAAGAARIAREYSGRKLETVLAALVTDMAVAAERPGSWEYERVTAWLSSHVWEVEPKD